MDTPDAGQNILTRQLPKTGQVTGYQAGDDGDDEHEAGWWKGRLNANNRTRFLAKTIAGDDIVFDRATGLMWPADGSAAGCNNGNQGNWSAAIIYANNLVFAGFSDWRLPNVKELMSIMDYSRAGPAIDTVFFINTPFGVYWSSTTDSANTDYAWFVNSVYGIVEANLKTIITSYLRAVRGGL